MTPNESPALRTNDEPQRILLEASERIKACYPNGTLVDVTIGNMRLNNVPVVYKGVGRFCVIDGWGFRHSFDPARDPHRVLP